jgi:hypothetical protein
MTTPGTTTTSNDHHQPAATQTPPNRNASTGDDDDGCRNSSDDDSTGCALSFFSLTDSLIYSAPMACDNKLSRHNGMRATRCGDEIGDDDCQVRSCLIHFFFFLKKNLSF